MRALTIVVILVISTLGRSFVIPAIGHASIETSAAGDGRAIFEQVRRELGAEAKTQSAYEAIEQLRTALDTIRDAVTAAPESVELGPMHASISALSERLKEVSSENGVNLDVMYESIEETTTDVEELQDKVERLKVLLSLTREIVKQVPPEKPVIKTWFELGSIVLKILVVNPSPTEAQTVPVKVYLPKEVSPKDILDLGDLELDYDAETGMYYVHSEVPLEPAQSMTKKVEMEDVWVFTEERLASLVTQAKEMASRLEETPSAAEAAALVLSIEQKVQEILKRQEETAANPSKHIRAYRQGVIMLTTIEQDLTALDRLKQDWPDSRSPDQQGSQLGSGDSRIPLGAGSGGPSEGGAPLGRSISMTTAWRMIFAVLALLAVLSVVFFMTWHRVLRLTMQREQQAVPLSTEHKGAENTFPGPELE